MAITDEAEKKIKRFLCSDVNHEALVALVLEGKPPRQRRLDKTPSGDISTIAVGFVLDNGGCLALNELKQRIDNLKEQADSEGPYPDDQT